jgi:hypothetical protein
MSTLRSSLSVIGLVAFVAGCSDTSGSGGTPLGPNAESNDAGSDPQLDVDSGAASDLDADLSDLGYDNGRKRDAGARDAGRRDSGVTDTGVADTGVLDTGTSDAGMVADSGDTDAGTTQDAAMSTDSGTGDPGDGTPTRMQCTGNFGNALSAQFGRMDGLLVSVIPPGGPSSCNGDARHVHLQVLIQGSVYDVAVNTDTLEATRDMPLPNGAWSEGWHPGLTNDYTQYGLHSTDFTTPSNAAQSIENFVATANHVSIFATGYGPTGAHDVHRHPSTGDGMIVIDPLASTAHVMMFCFNTDTF